MEMVSYIPVQEAGFFARFKTRLKVGETGVKPALAVGAAAVNAHGFRDGFELRGKLVSNNMDQGVAHAGVGRLAFAGFFDVQGPSRPIFLRLWLYTRFCWRNRDNAA